MPEVKTEALDDKVVEKLAEVKVATLLALLSEIKSEVLMNTNIRRNSGLNIRRDAYQKIGLRANKGGSYDSYRMSGRVEGTGAGENRQTH